MSEDDSLPRRIFRGILWIEDATLVALVGALIFFAGLQIVLRLLFHTAILWADPLMRTLVLWTAMLGAMAAARDDKHLRVDAAERFLKGIPGRVVRILTRGFAALICAILAWQCARFVGIDREDAAIAFLGVPRWVCETILPIAFSVMALRFLFAAFARPTEHA